MNVYCLPSTAGDRIRIDNPALLDTTGAEYTSKNLNFSFSNPGKWPGGRGNWPPSIIWVVRCNLGSDVHLTHVHV